MNISYADSSVAVPTGRVYSIFFTYDVMTDRRYVRGKTVRSWTNLSGARKRYVDVRNIITSIDELLLKGGFPKDMHPTRQYYSVLASDTNFLIPQVVHSDELEAKTYGNNSKKQKKS